METKGKGILTTITSNPTFKKVAGAAIIIGGFLTLKKLFRSEDEIVSDAEWIEGNDDENDVADEDGK